MKKILLLLLLFTTTYFAQSIGTGIGEHTLFSSSDGKVYAWGRNDFGQLGNNSTSNSRESVSVDFSGVLSGKTISAVATGYVHSIALDSNGKVYAWGDNRYGQLGNNSNTNSIVPVAVDVSGVLLGKTIISIASGGNHSLALDSDGKVYAWGYNDHGQYGNNTTTTRNVPVEVDFSGVLSGKTITAIAAGNNHSIALDSDGKVYAWGYGLSGQIGDRYTFDRHVPVAVNASGALLGKTIIAVAAGANHSIALSSDGKVYAWGRNDPDGQLGNNSTVNNSVPQAVITSGVLSGKIITAIAGGVLNSIALASDGTVYTWGDNSFGELGVGFLEDGYSKVPVAVNTSGVLSGKTITAVAAGYEHFIVLDSDGKVYTWGYNSSGQLGNNSSDNGFFPVKALLIPVVTTNEVSNISLTFADCDVNVTSDNGYEVTARGTCWSTSHNPTTSNSKTTNGTGTGTFTSSITGLSSDTQYYIRAYATNSNGTSYGEEKNFTTSDGRPTVTTNEVSNDGTTANCGGNVIFDNGYEVTARGVCWSTNQNPTTSDSKTTNGTGIGTFTSSITGLSLTTQYYVRAYAINEIGISYGEERSFTTSDGSPTVTTNEATTDGITANCGGNVIFDNGYEVSARGVCWSTSQNPTTSNSKTTDGDGTGAFTSSITGLNGATLYYVRAYATNSIGTSYGEERSFTTDNFPNVTTNDISSVSTTTINCGGNVTSDNGYTVTARGVCWSTSSNPTISNSHTTDGAGIGSFASSLTGLYATTLYYYRAYAINSIGINYGMERSIDTDPGVTSVSTSSVTNIGLTTADCGGNVTSDMNVTARGVCWSTSHDPTISNSKTTDGTGAGTFTSSITGLSSDTQYYVRAYATDKNGTYYGEERGFINYSPTVTTNECSNLSTTSADCGGNVTSEGSASVTARGVCWSTSTNPTISNSHTTDGSGIGEFTSSITGLGKNTKYYVRAFATNSSGTAYGEEKEFSTPIELRNALCFDGNNQNVNCTLTLPDQGTIETWVYLSTTSEGQRIFDGGNAASKWYLTYTASDGYHLVIGNSSSAQYTFSTTQKWHHVAVTWNRRLGVSVDFSLYINGNLVDFVTGNTWTNPASTFNIGSTYNSLNYLFGKLDEFRIWNYVRSNAQIFSEMYNKIDPSTSGLICYYNFDQTSVSTITDGSSAGKNGTLNNMSTTSWEKSTAPIGDLGITVLSNIKTSVGNSGMEIKTTIFSPVPPTNANNLGTYSYGDGSESIDADDFPSGVTSRANIIWGVKENGNCTANLEFVYSDVTGVTNESALKLLKRTDASSPWTDVTTSATQNTGNHSFTMTGLTSFSEFSIGDGGDNPLPVELTTFTAKVDESKILLQWQTATEVNNYGFEVERQILNQVQNDDNWQKIGFIEGHGNSNSTKEYSFVDTDKLSGVVQYRLKQIDIDGGFEYSDIVNVEMESPKEFKLSQNYPNPFNPSTVISYTLPVNSKVKVEIFNTLGQSVGVLVNSQKHAGFYETTWNAANLPSGIYLISIKANGLSSNKNFTQVKKALLLK